MEPPLRLSRPTGDSDVLYHTPAHRNPLTSDFDGAAASAESPDRGLRRFISYPAHRNPLTIDFDGAATSSESPGRGLRRFI